MRRRLLYLPPDITSRTVKRDDSAPENRRHEKTERYGHQRKLLEDFGELVLEKTSGVMRRVRTSTPPQGMTPMTPQQMAAAEQRDLSYRWVKIEHELPNVNALVIPVDSGVDALMEKAIEFALRLKVPILLLQQRVAIHIESRDRYLHRGDLTYVIYDDEVAMEHAIVRFMNGVPLARPRRAHA